MNKINKINKQNKFNNYQNLEDNLILNNLIDFLSYQDNIELSKTNKNNRLLFKKAIKNDKITKIIIGSIYRPKIWSEFQNILNNLEPPENLLIPPDMIQILDYSITKKQIKYRYIPVGIYKNIYYPILNDKVKLMSIQVQHPQFITPIYENIEDFFNKWEKIIDNSHIVYSINYIHPLLKYFFIRVTNIIFFSFMFFLCYFIFVFFFILMKNNFMVENNLNPNNFINNHLINIDNIDLIYSFQNNNTYNNLYEYNDQALIPIILIKNKNLVILNNFNHSNY